ncbi:AraC family transcriptional regulator N-terminal domain-containing protein [Methylopila henanensis]|uniref:AraC family transcriptional regulator N-terminal domain-containing protein n=1 Tax=Methylopila henanensis TaxID=873516 RepID=A0ABW4K1G8_9HYPH
MPHLNALAALIARYAPTDGTHETPVPNLTLYRASQPSEPTHGMYEPAFCIVAQGRKQIELAGETYIYDGARSLIVSVDLPVVGRVIEATEKEPYLGAKLSLDPQALNALLIEHRLDRREPSAGVAVSLADTTSEMLDAFTRLVGLLGAPHDIGALAPLAEREILYRLLTGALAARVRQIATADSKISQVNRAIDWIKRNFNQPFRMEQVCAAANMSPSALHAHFKTVTSMSPLQYQKHLRLQEARRLIVSNARDAATAGHAVGYESPSQFSREYRRLFGAPPIRDAARLRETPAAELSVG